MHGRQQFNDPPHGPHAHCGPNPRHRHHRGRGGYGDWGPGFGPPFGGPGFGRGRRRMRRGDVRAAILVLLAEEPRNGYGLIQEIEQRSDGAWRPSPGSVYPALAMLEDEGLVKSEAVDGGKRFTLTDAGEQHVSENREQLGEPWANLGEPSGGARGDLRAQVKPLMGAVAQVFAVGSEDDAKRVAAILADARRKVYAILADADVPDEPDA